MRRFQRALMCFTLLVLVVEGCSAPATAPTATGKDAPAAEALRPQGQKRLTVGITEELTALSLEVASVAAGFTPAGAQAIQRMVNPGMAVPNERGILQPALATEVPTIENGLWRVLPDGRMETTWKLRPGVQWHDGTPLTSADFVFSAALGLDGQITAFRVLAFDALDRVEAPDTQTVTAYWKRPYIDADSMFSNIVVVPKPAHLLQEAYQEDPANLVYHPFWTSQYVGTGPFRLKEWSQGSHLILAANPQYVAGRPKIDEIEVRMITDSNALLASFLSGVLLIAPLERGLSLEQGIQARDRVTAAGGQLVILPRAWVEVVPQFLNATPPVVTDVRFRRALLHALDRQEIVDTVEYGLTGVAHVMLTPDDPDYEDVKDAAVRYDYDPTRAARLLEELGYRKGADGMYLDSAGQPLAVEARAMAGLELLQKTLFIAADAWKRFGIDVDPVVYPQQRVRDLEYTATFPGLQLWRAPNTFYGLRNRRSNSTPLPENQYRGGNVTRYQNPEWDALLDRYFSTIARAPRMEAARSIIRHQTEQLLDLGLFYDANPYLVHNRVKGFTVANQGWNVSDWDLS
jgi:peptide/nickel transport system substrate-binding protein